MSTALTLCEFFGGQQGGPSVQSIYHTLNMNKAFLVCATAYASAVELFGQSVFHIQHMKEISHLCDFPEKINKKGFRVIEERYIKVELQECSRFVKCAGIS